MRTPIRTTLAVALLTLGPAAAQAGPPLLCFPLSIGNAPSLPWGSGAGWNSPAPGYDRASLAGDTVALLAPQTRVLVRMETLRRAVLYASTDADAAGRLFGALRARRGDANGQGDPLAVFDLGYAVEAYRQTRWLAGVARIEPPEDGLALVSLALSRRGPDAEMQYAAALLTRDGHAPDLAYAHLRAALQGAADDPDLARTIAAHRPLWGTRLDDAQAQVRRAGR